MIGMARIKREGGPIHPDDVLWECDCMTCQWAVERQLREWADYNGIDPPADAQ